MSFEAYIVPGIDTFVYLDTFLMKPFVMFQCYYSSVLFSCMFNSKKLNKIQ